MIITPATMAELAQYASRMKCTDGTTFTPKEIWILCPEVRRLAGENFKEQDDKLAILGKHPAFQLPDGYNILVGATDYEYPYAYLHWFEGNGMCAAFFERVKNNWTYMGTPQSIMSEDTKETFSEDVILDLWTRWWVTTSRLARKQAYCQQSRQFRMTPSGPIPLINVVRWRKTTSESNIGSAIPLDVAWSHRWIVRAHLRHLEDGRIIPVREHEKGPIGLPLIEKMTVDAAIR